MSKRLFGLKKKQARGLVMAVALTLVAFTGFSGLSMVGSVGSAPQQPSQDTPENAVVEQQPAPTVATSAPKELFKVVKVVDGDTIDVEIAGKTERLRLLGINTPEVVDPRKPVECFGKEASAHAREILDGKSVALESDATQGDKDKYGRLLRYISLEDGTDLNKSMIADGYAYEYTYDKPYARQADYKAAETQAKNAQQGLWAPDKCDGKLTAVKKT